MTGKRLLNTFLTDRVLEANVLDRRLDMNIDGVWNRKGGGTDYYL